MIIVLGSVVVRAGHLDEALSPSRAHVARSLAEPGCLAHAVQRDVDHDRRLVFVERWVDREALRTHFAVPASRGFGRALAALADGDPAIELFEAVPIGMPRQGTDGSA